MRQFSETIILQRAKDLIVELEESITYIKTNNSLPSKEIFLSTGKKMNLFIKRFLNREITMLTFLEDDPYFLPKELASIIHQLVSQLNKEIKRVNTPKEGEIYSQMKEKIKYLFSLSENSSGEIFNSPTRLKKEKFPDGSNVYHFLNGIQKGKYHIQDASDQDLSILTRYLQFFCQYQKLAKRFPKDDKTAFLNHNPSNTKIESLLDLAEYSLINFDMTRMNYYQNLLYPLIKENYLSSPIEENSMYKSLRIV